MAGGRRLDEIPQVGDYTTYNIGDQSILLLRAEDGVKAYHNFCPHRGTSLSEGCGHFENGRIICPFHGWKWDLQGNNHFVLERQEFRGGQLQDKDVALRQVQSVVFAGFVLINMSKEPEPFDDYIAPMRDWLEICGIDLMRNYWWKAIPSASNWKVAQEAFFEGYHVPATHPQLEKLGAEVIYGDRPESSIEFAHKNVYYDALQKGTAGSTAEKRRPWRAM